MKTVRFKKKKLKILGDYTWDDLLVEDASYAEDVRFTLYDGYVSDPIAMAIMFDIDHFPKEKENHLCNIIEEAFSGIEWYLVATGRGYHVYLPLVAGFTRQQVPNYKQSYLTKLNLLEKQLEHSFDKGVFGATKYGRAVGSSNSKNGNPVYCVMYSDAPRLKDIDSFLTFVVVEKTPIIFESKKEESGLEQHALYKHCPLIYDSCQKHETIPYELWKYIMLEFANRESLYAAHDFSQRIEGYDKEAVDDFFTNPKTYLVGCERVRTMYYEWRNETPCDRCSHKTPGNSLCNVHGPWPTPSRHNGFHTWFKTKEASGVNPKSVEPQDIAGEFFNRHEKSLTRDDCTLYIFNGTHYEELAQDIERPKYWSQAMMKKIMGIPTYGINRSNHMMEVGRHLLYYSTEGLASGEALDVDLISFANGVYRISDATFHQHDRKFKVTSTLSYAYNPEAKCDTFLTYLKRSLFTDDKVALLQTFAGLAISNIPVSEVQQFLWIYGQTDTGKSGFVNVIKNLLCTGEDVSNPYVSMQPQRILKAFEQFPYDIRGKKLLWVDDLKLRESHEKAHAFEEWIVPFVSNPIVDCKVPYKASVQATNTMTVILTSNYIPEILKKGEGIMRRLRTVKFHAPMTEDEDRNRLLHCLNDEQEQQGILMWALQGLRMALDRKQNGYKLLPEYTTEELAFRQHVAVTTGDTAFVEFIDSLEINSGHDGEFISDLERVYRQLPEAKGFLSTNQFSRDVVEAVSNKLNISSEELRKRRNKDGNKRSFIAGVKIRYLHDD